ncbi:MAG: PAS domain-containing sensor histidine kinase, partial [Myxococcales bacterium]
MSDGGALLANRPLAAFARLLDSSEDGYAVLDREMRYVYLNERLVELNAHRLDELLGRTVDEVYPGFSASPLGQRYWRVMRGGAEEHFEEPVSVPRPPHLIWYRISLFPHEQGLLVRAHDISARKQAEQERDRLLSAMVSERVRLELLLDASPAIVSFFRGPEHVFSFVNARLRELIPGSERLLGLTAREARPALAPHGLVDQLDRVYRTGEPLAVREQAVALPSTPGGSTEAFFDFTYQPIRRPDGEIEGVASFAVEVTESVRARRAVEQVARREEAARRVAEEASRAKDEFLSTLSHELRTPLNAVIGWSHLLRSGGVAEAQRERALETIERNARAQARLIEDMLDLGRIVQGKMVLSVGPVEMVRVVEAAIDSMRLAAEAKGVRLQPVLDSHATIVGDAERLQQLVWNLLSNAIKFTPRGGRVQVRLRREASCVEVVVADTGQGIE